MALSAARGRAAPDETCLAVSVATLGNLAGEPGGRGGRDAPRVGDTVAPPGKVLHPGFTMMAAQARLGAHLGGCRSLVLLPGVCFRVWRRPGLARDRTMVCNLLGSRLISDAPQGCEVLLLFMQSKIE